MTKNIEVSLEEANNAEQLTTLLKKKAEEKVYIDTLKGLSVLKKSKFYYNSQGEIREHIATYKGFCILIKQEHIKRDLNEKETEMYPSLVAVDDLKHLKKVNGNVIRKLNPNSLHYYEKISLIQGVIPYIDGGKL